MNLDDLLFRNCPWLTGEGDENDIVISSRIRLARNIVGFPFPVRATEHDQCLVLENVRQAAEKIFPENEYCFLALQSLPTLDREFLRERQLLSKNIGTNDRVQAALLDHQERFCITVNEDDHLTILSSASGLAPQKIWEQLNVIDDQLASVFDYVFHEKYGFLTSAVTTVGTGMKTFFVLHLPALVITQEMDKVIRSLQKKSMSVGSMYSNGSQALGDFFQISNRTTIGKSEEELIEKMTDFIPQVVSYERKARDFLLHSRRDVIYSRCSRAMDVLRTAKTISNVETILHLSNLRLGIHTGLLGNLDIAAVNSLLLFTQSAHLQKLQRQNLQKGNNQWRNNSESQYNNESQFSQTEQDVMRAMYIRQTLEQSG